MALAGDSNEAEETDRRKAMGTYEAGGTNRITAKETINGVEHLLVLEEVPTGQYEEVSLDRVQSPDLGCVDPVIFLG